MIPRLHILPWDRPLLPQVVDFLAAGWNGDRPLDLSNLLIVVPTRQSGRRLREALAARAATHRQAVLSPRVVPPEALTVLALPATGIASRMASQLAWMSVLRGMAIDRFRAVFPVDPPARDAAWARRLAHQFLTVQATLAEAGLRMGGVVARAGEDFPETQRWRQLGELEAAYDAALAARGLRDSQAAKIGAAETAALPPGIARVLVAGTPDPLPLAVQVLAGFARCVPVDILAGGPVDRPATELFDPWGRPIEESWRDRRIDWPGFSDRVHLCADPAEQAARLVALVGEYPEPEGVLAVGIADGEILPALESGLAHAAVPAFNPEGRTRRQDVLFGLLSRLADFARDEAIAAVAAMLRHIEILEWLRAGAEPAWSPADLLAEFDRLAADHLPPTLAEAQRHAPPDSLVARALAALADLRTALVAGGFPDGAAAALAKIFAGRRFPVDSPLVEAASAWQEVAADAGAALALFPGTAGNEAWDLALEHYGELVSFAPRPRGALELNGWLELLWEDAAHLAVAGMNDDFVPDAIVGDAFLPEVLRGRLGLKVNAGRFARDAYLLSLLAETRRGQGRLDILLGKTAQSGEPLRPSRLLLRCADAELPARVDLLFREVSATGANVPWTRAWRLRPRAALPLRRLSVTALRDYLECPFRFYLRHVLRLKAVDPAKAELDASDFGRLLHAALQTLGEDEKLRGCADEGILRDALVGAFEREARRRYGEALTLPLHIQFESARQRLRRAATVQAAEAAQGWKIVETERAFEFAVGDRIITGKIDRVDRHKDGRIRLLDYKTSDRASLPAEVHLARGQPDRAPLPEALVPGTPGPLRWVDLQLPLYRRALAGEFGAAIACGYFALPKAVGDTAINPWTDFSAELQRSADACADAVVRAVAAGRFWPPAELGERERDDFAALFHHGAADSIDPAAITGGQS